MGTTTLPNRYEINGIIDTNNSVLDNLTTLCNASGCWLTYDNYAGAWSVIINRSGTSVYSFNDSNIVGPISISGTGLYNLYNSVRVSFPHEDLRNQKSYVQIDIPLEDRFPNEPDNILQIDYPVVTNPVQAQLLGFIELKQSRVDKIITFNTDYSVLGIKAGDVIDVTNSIYNFTNKLFRVITIKESDGADNNIELEITALEYSSDVYDESTLSRYTVTNENGIVAIGAIPAPTTPTVTAYELVSNPRVSATTTINGGIVDEVEFWYTTDVPPAVNDDNLRTYNLLGSIKPENTALFSDGETVTLEVPSLNAGEFLIKARCKNPSAVSAFSNPSGILTYNAKQTTDAIGPDTQQVDENGNVIGTLGLSAMLALANEFFGGNAAVGPGGGSGSGSTFLLLELQNFNTNSTTGGETIYSGSKFIPVVRVIPPGVPGIVEGLDQRALNQCIIGDQTLAGGYLDVLTAFPSGSSTAATVTASNWPQYYPHKILQLCNATQQINPNSGPTYIYYGVDLNAYRYYYPTATNFQLEIRGYWQIEDQVTQYTITNSNPGNVGPVSNSVWKTTTVGTAPIRANAYVWTGANVTALTASGNPPFISSNTQFSTQGIGSSGNVVVTASVYPAQLGNNIQLISTGDHITTFSYDFTKPAYQAPKFNSFNLATPIQTTISIPKSWQVNKSGNIIANVVPDANVTISSVLRSVGTQEVQEDISGSGGTYIHYFTKRTKINGNFVSNFRRGAGINPYQLVFSDVALVPYTANVFQYDYVESQSSFYEGPEIPTGPSTGIQEWWNLVGGRFGSSESGDGQVYDETYANTYSPIRRLYSNMAKINTTSMVFVSPNYIQKSLGATNEQYIPRHWAQLKANANVSSHNQNDFNFTGAIAAGQWWDRFGSDNFPYVEPTFTATNYDVGFFYNNANVEINHLQIGGNINANANVDAGFGIWVTST